MRVSGVLVAWESRGCGGGASAAGLPASAASAAAFAAGLPGTGVAAETACVVAVRAVAVRAAAFCALGAADEWGPMVTASASVAARPTATAIAK